MNAGVFLGWFRSVDASALAVFRIGFGLLLTMDMVRYGFILDIHEYYQQPEFLFYYWQLDWITPLPGAGMQWLYGGLAVAALGMTVGALYRFSSAVFVVGFAYAFLLDESRYLNHFYMVFLFASLLACMPAAWIWSVDRWLADRRGGNVCNQVPYWCYWVLIFQLEVILIYAGLVKLTPDWLALEPLSSWLSYRADLPIVGHLFTQQWAVALAAYGVIALHLVGAPLLLWSRTRLAVICIYAAFHMLNHFVFEIGIFPWMTLFASLMMFGPDWPRRLWARLGQRGVARQKTTDSNPGEVNHKPFRYQGYIVALILLWSTVQVVLPLRHLAFPGDVAWTEEGHRFSWRMKLRDKRGLMEYVVGFNDGSHIRIIPDRFLNNRQRNTLPCQPDMIWKMAFFLQQELSNDQRSVVSVKADARCSLNGRVRQQIVDPEVNLLAVDYDLLGSSHWITELTQPLR